MPTLFWNAGEKEVIKGLDILCFCKVDQDRDKAWVSVAGADFDRAKTLQIIQFIYRTMD